MSTYLIVSAEFLTTGGQDRANYGLASYLARRGHRVHLVAHQVDAALLRDGDVTWHRAPKPLGSTLLGEPFLQRIGTNVARSLAPEGARVITNGGNCDWPADANWVHYVHAAYERQPEGAVRKLRYRVAHKRFLAGERRAIGTARLVIANSMRTADDVERLLDISSERIRTVYYGIDPDQFSPAALTDAVPVVLFVGALGDRRKGFDVLLRAWEMLCRDGNWPARLRVVGRGTDLREWRSRVATMKLGDHVEFLGFRANVAELLRGAALLVSPARYEPYGLGVHEALCCGVPAIVSARAGVAERYPDELKHLLLPDPNDAGDLAKRIRHSLAAAPERDRASLRRFSDTLRARTWDEMAAEIEELIESARRSPASQPALVTTS